MTRNLSAFIVSITTFLSLAVLGGLLAAAIHLDQPPSETAKNYCFEYGAVETGATNLVTAIYLEYRAFDTLGETIVLLLAVTGVIFFLERSHAQN